MSGILYPAAVAQTAVFSLSEALDRRAGDLTRLRADIKRNNVVHIIIIIAIIVLLLLAAALVTAAIILCAQHGGVLEFVVKLDPWYVKVGCKKL